MDNLSGGEAIIAFILFVLFMWVMFALVGIAVSIGVDAYEWVQGF